MSKAKVLVQTPHPIFDGEGHPMSHGHVYTVNVDETIEKYFLEGLLTLAEEEQETAPKEESKKSQPIKNSKAQETEPVIHEENSNG